MLKNTDAATTRDRSNFEHWSSMHAIRNGLDVQNIGRVQFPDLAGFSNGVAEFVIDLDAPQSCASRFEKGPFAGWGGLFWTFAVQSYGVLPDHGKLTFSICCQTGPFADANRVFDRAPRGKLMVVTDQPLVMAQPRGESSRARSLRPNLLSCFGPDMEFNALPVPAGMTRRIAVLG